MKKLLLSLMAIVLLSLSANASNISTKSNLENEKPENWIRVLTLLLSLDSPDIDYERGTNKVIGGKRYACIDGGLCRLRTGSSTKRNVSTKDLSLGNHLVIDQNGVVALLINKEQARSNADFNLSEGSFSIINTYPLKSMENCPKEFEAYSIEANKKYDLEELENHYAIILKK